MTKEEAARILDPATTVEALAEIEYYAGFSSQRARVQAVNEAYEIAVAALREQLTTNCHQLEPVTNRNGLTGWISVEDRLPEVGERVLVYSFFDGMNVGWVQSDGRFSVKTPYPDRPTHWMPLPEPPEEEPYETKKND